MSYARAENEQWAEYWALVSRRSCALRQAFNKNEDCEDLSGAASEILRGPNLHHTYATLHISAEWPGSLKKGNRFKYGAQRLEFGTQIPRVVIAELLGPRCALPLPVVRPMQTRVKFRMCPALCCSASELARCGLILGPRPVEQRGRLVPS